MYENYASSSVFLEFLNFSMHAKGSHYWLFSEAHGDTAPPDSANKLTKRHDTSLVNFTGIIELNLIKIYWMVKVKKSGSEIIRRVSGDYKNKFNVPCFAFWKDRTKSDDQIWCSKSIKTGLLRSYKPFIVTLQEEITWVVMKSICAGLSAFPILRFQLLLKYSSFTDLWMFHCILGEVM